MLWNIRKFVKSGDYVYAVVPEHPKTDKHGYVLAHRVIMENILDRLLLDNEEVHHIDKNGKNNDVSNLEVLTRAEHHRRHAKYPPEGHYIELICKQCGKKFNRLYHLRPNAKKYKNCFCSRSCEAKFQFGKEDFTHGTSSSYSYRKCRCDVCKAGQAKRLRDYRKKKHAVFV
jgi:hypothetical protein